MSRIRAQPLSSRVFAPYGDVIEANAERALVINDGNAIRFDDLAQIDVATASGRPRVSLFRAQPRRLPMQIVKLERHPLGSQAFVRLGTARFIAVVSHGDSAPAVESLAAFVVDDVAGINLHRNVWHHALLALDRESDFLVIDRGGEGENLEEVELPQPVWLEL